MTIHSLRYHLLALATLAVLSYGWSRSQQQSRALEIRAELSRIQQAHQQKILRCCYNLANADTVGYRALTIGDEAESLVPRPGEAMETRNPTDLAIAGDGYFVVARGQEFALTRDGHFSFVDGLLVSSQGYPVLGYPCSGPSGVVDKGHLVERQVNKMEIRLPLDPRTLLYNGKYTGYHFDGVGVLYGDSTMTDPVTGQQVTTNTPLFKLALAVPTNLQGLRMESLPSTTLIVGPGGLCWGTAGEMDYGFLIPNRLERSNVDVRAQLNMLRSMRRYSGLFFDSPSEAERNFCQQGRPVPLFQP